MSTRAERVLWNCPNCDVSDYDTPDVIAFLVAAHNCQEAP